MKDKSNWFRDKYPVGTRVRFQPKCILNGSITGTITDHIYNDVAIIEALGLRWWIGGKRILEKFEE